MKFKEWDIVRVGIYYYGEITSTHKAKPGKIPEGKYELGNDDGYFYAEEDLTLVCRAENREDR